MVLATTALIAVCTLSGFSGFPNRIVGDVGVLTKKWVLIQVKSDNRKNHIELTIPRNQCKIRKK